jgi:hypothetical protein
MSEATGTSTRKTEKSDSSDEDGVDPRRAVLLVVLMNIVRKRGLEVNTYRRMLPHMAALIAIGLGVPAASLFAAAADRAARFCTSCDIACAPGQNHAVQLARCWQPVVEWRFDRDLGNWQVKNYQKALKIEIADDAAWGRSLFVHRDDKEIDTALELTSPPIPVAEAALCRLTIAANSSRGAVRARVNVGVEASQVQVMFEDRRLAAQSGAWEDHFAPYAVHVYAW